MMRSSMVCLRTRPCSLLSSTIRCDFHMMMTAGVRTTKTRTRTKVRILSNRNMKSKKKRMKRRKKIMMKKGRFRRRVRKNIKHTSLRMALNKRSRISHRIKKSKTTQDSWAWIRIHPSIVNSCTSPSKCSPSSVRRLARHGCRHRAAACS